MCCAWIWILSLIATASAHSEETEPAGIIKLETAQEAAWNAHDARAYADLFVPDADLVSSAGAVFHGRGEIEQRSGEDFATVFASSKVRLGEVHLRSLGPDTMLARMEWSLSGIRTRGDEERDNRTIVQSQVLARVGDSWQIVSLQNTIAFDEIASGLPNARAAHRTPVPAVTKPDRRCIVGRSNGNCIIYGK